MPPVVPVVPPVVVGLVVLSPPQPSEAAAPATVSQQIRRLEEETGVTLLRRTTRRLALTEAGESFHEGCVAMVAAARAAHDGLADLQESPVGELRVSAPAQFAVTHLVAALAPFLKAHPALSLQAAGHQ